MTYKVERLWGGFSVILWLFKAFEIIPNAQRYEADPYSEEIIRVGLVLQLSDLKYPRADSRCTPGTIPPRERARGVQGHAGPVL